MSKLFTPLSIGALELENRIIVAPMCQYSAKDGAPNDWHKAHFAQFAMSGAGLFITEVEVAAMRATVDASSEIRTCRTQTLHLAGT